MGLSAVRISNGLSKDEDQQRILGSRKIKQQDNQSHLYKVQAKFTIH